jgi:RNA polymerase sigma-70 factor (ECF subfamily)
MEQQTVQQLLRTLTDHEVVERVRSGEAALFEILIRRHNQRLFRVARAIVGDDDEAEDVVQETHVRAYRGLGGFEGRAQYSTWVTRIAIREALARVKERRKFLGFDLMEVAAASDRSVPPEDPIMRIPAPEHRSPVEETARRELRDLLTGAVDALPRNLRLVFALREVEGLSTEETAAALSLTETNVKVRLHRARRALRRRLETVLDKETRSLYAFHLVRCDRVVDRVFARIQAEAP